jgi:hypothetical protein
MPKGSPGLTKIEKVCEYCGEVFYTTTANPTKRTCSRDCSYRLRGDARKLTIQKTCAVCGATFEVPLHRQDTALYCSKDCMYDRNAAATTRTCAVCGKEFRSPPSQTHVKTCSTECGYTLRSGENHPGFKGVTYTAINKDGRKVSHTLGLYGLTYGFSGNWDSAPRRPYCAAARRDS